MNKKISYKDSGVDIEAGNKLVSSIKDNVAATKNKGVIENYGGFAGLFDLKAFNYKDPLLVSGTDGVGTKLKIAIDHNRLDHIGQDLVAMCVNDIAVQGAKPLFFLDYYACSKLDLEQSKTVINSVAKACKDVGAALLGGETAEMPGMYNNNDFDLAGFAVGAVEREELLPKMSEIKAGDKIIGINSSGVHSNGFSLVRKIFSEHKIDYRDKADFSDKSYLDILLEPTALYINICQKLQKTNLVKAFCHVTGGGIIENLPRIMPKGLEYDIDFDKLELPDLYKWLKEKANIDNKELYTAFNCGYGMISIADSQSSEEIVKIIESSGHKAKLLGLVKSK
jgi:phosphoribosylaminoimidazole synthetase